jgi:hypothetical protein
MAAVETSVRAFDVGRVVQRTFSAIGRNLATFATLTVLMYGLPRLALSWLNIQFNPALAHASMADPIRLIASTFSPYSLATGFVMGALAILTQAVIAFCTITDLSGRRPTAAECVNSVVRSAVPIVVIGLVKSWATVIGMFLLLVPGCLVAVVWIVAIPVETLEHRGIFGAFSRSRALTRGNRWAIFALLAAFFIVVAVVGYTVQQIFLGSAATNPNYLAAALNPAYLTATAVLGVISTIVASAGAASIYYELTWLKDGAPHSALATVFD